MTCNHVCPGPGRGRKAETKALTLGPLRWPTPCGAGQTTTARSSASGRATEGARPAPARRPREGRRRNPFGLRPRGAAKPTGVGG
eukprot:5536871-Pyramimonas_sp.AAC.1